MRLARKLPAQTCCRSGRAMRVYQGRAVECHWLFPVTIFAIRALAIANGQLGVADGVHCPAMWAAKTIAMAEFPSPMHSGVHLSVISSFRRIESRLRGQSRTP